jgi:hypothetical protein
VGLPAPGGSIKGWWTLLAEPATELLTSGDDRSGRVSAG